VTAGGTKILIHGLVKQTQFRVIPMNSVVVTQRELSNTAKLSVYKSVFVPISRMVMNLK